MRCRIVAWKSWMWTLFSTAANPNGSVAPEANPPFTPPRVIQTIELLRRFRLLREIDRLGGFRLHAKRQLVAGYPRPELRFLRLAIEVFAIEIGQEIELVALPGRRRPFRRRKIDDRRAGG